MMATDLRFPLPKCRGELSKKGEIKERRKFGISQQWQKQREGRGACIGYAPAINCMKIKSLIEICKESF